MRHRLGEASRRWTLPTRPLRRNARRMTPDRGELRLIKGSPKSCPYRQVRPGRRSELDPAPLSCCLGRQRAPRPPSATFSTPQVDDGPDTGVRRSPPPRLGHETRVSRPEQRVTVAHAGVACWRAAQVPGVEEPLPGHLSACPHFLDAPDLRWSTARRASKCQVATKGPVSPSRTSARVAPDRPPARMNRAPARTAAAARPRMQASGWRRPRAARGAGTAARSAGIGSAGTGVRPGHEAVRTAGSWPFVPAFHNSPLPHEPDRPTERRSPG